ncbi:MAG: cytochrome c [Candidatus Melainabacteria bacterium]|nr:cytochrome c [Candidatus Melainabacteria bacterium]
MSRIPKMIALVVLVVATTCGCAMSEEMRRINQMKEINQRRDLQMTTDLSGQQVFVRSCNSCHPGAKQGMGPALDKLGEHFPSDEKLKKFIRQGVGSMPPQPKDALDDQELENLVVYLRALKFEEKK